MYAPVLTAAPAGAPVSLDEAKLHLRVDGSDEDDRITGLIAAAVGHLDGWIGVLGRAIVTQTWRQDFDTFARRLRLPLFPVASVTSVAYVDVDGVTQTVATDRYRLRANWLGAYVQFVSTFDAPNVDAEGAAVSVTFVAGSAIADVPPPIKQAILLLVGHWFANRETVVTGTIATSLPMAVDALLTPFRRIGI